MAEVTKDDLIEIACRFSQELRDFCDNATEAGSPLPCTEELLKEWDEAYWKFNSTKPYPYSKVEGQFSDAV
ncbi:MAG: hypothetical protein COA86_02660 [Kangiella sp.]|nr:MAG: hypothetical protein COA86_02660 [Kangiella sp.]